MLALQVGNRVAYEDMANPRREGTVLEAGIGWHNAEYRIRWDDGTESTSDCRQVGWKPAVDLIGCKVDGCTATFFYVAGRAHPELCLDHAEDAERAERARQRGIKLQRTTHARTKGIVSDGVHVGYVIEQGGTSTDGRGRWDVYTLDMAWIGGCDRGAQFAAERYARQLRERIARVSA